MYEYNLHLYGFSWLNKQTFIRFPYTTGEFHTTRMEALTDCYLNGCSRFGVHEASQTLVPNTKKEIAMARSATNVEPVSWLHFVCVCMHVCVCVCTRTRMRRHLCVANAHNLKCKSIMHLQAVVRNLDSHMPVDSNTHPQ